MLFKTGRDLKKKRRRKVSPKNCDFKRHSVFVQKQRIILQENLKNKLCIYKWIRRRDLWKCSTWIWDWQELHSLELTGVECVQHREHQKFSIHSLTSRIPSSIHILRHVHRRFVNQFSPSNFTLNCPIECKFVMQNFFLLQKNFIGHSPFFHPND